MSLSGIVAKASPAVKMMWLSWPPRVETEDMRTFSSSDSRVEGAERSTVRPWIRDEEEG
jgi:hypothetical protein